MTLVDTSAWVEYLRATGSATHRAVRRILHGGEPAHTTDVVVMEVLAGARETKLCRALRSRPSSTSSTMRPPTGPSDVPSVESSASLRM